MPIAGKKPKEAAAEAALGQAAAKVSLECVRNGQ